MLRLLAVLTTLARFGRTVAGAGTIGAGVALFATPLQPHGFSMLSAWSALVMVGGAVLAVVGILLVVGSYMRERNAVTVSRELRRRLGIGEILIDESEQCWSHWRQSMTKYIEIRIDKTEARFFDRAGRDAGAATRRGRSAELEYVRNALLPKVEALFYDASTMLRVRDSAARRR
jgi:hypothetical protein